MNNLQSYLQRQTLPEIPWVTPFDSTMNAIKKMYDGNAGAVLVRENSQLVGLFSETDCIRSLLKRGAATLISSVADVMTTKVFYATLDNQLEDCLRIMTQKKVRHLPVFSDENILGLLNLETVVSALLEEKDFTIAQLTHYITGSGFPDVTIEDCSDKFNEIALTRTTREYCQLAV